MGLVIWRPPHFEPPVSVPKSDPCVATEVCTICNAGGASERTAGRACQKATRAEETAVFPAASIYHD